MSVPHHSETMQSLIWVFVVAVVLNYLWELAQAPLYVGLHHYNARVFWHCFIASLGDGIMVLLIVTAGWLTLRPPDWFVRPGLPDYVVMVIAGLVLAAVVEWVAVHILNRWDYTENMPKLPGLNIGVVPVAQMLIVPLLVFRTVAFLRLRTK